MTVETKKTNPAPSTVEIPLPPGMSKEDFVKSFASFNKMRDYTAKRDKCVRTALNGLKDKYPAEFKALLDAELKKVGLPVKG